MGFGVVVVVISLVSTELVLDLIDLTSVVDLGL